MISDPHGEGLGWPVAGSLYHGVFPGDDDAAIGAEEEDGVSPATVHSYEAAVGWSVAWVYFSHNWFQGRAFPAATATWIRGRGAIPFIRLMLRSSAEKNVAEPVYRRPLPDLKFGEGSFFVSLADPAPQARITPRSSCPF